MINQKAVAEREKAVVRRPLIADELAKALGPPLALCAGLFVWALIFGLCPFSGRGCHTRQLPSRSTTPISCRRRTGIIDRELTSSLRGWLPSIRAAQLRPNRQVSLDEFYWTGWRSDRPDTRARPVWWSWTGGVLRTPGCAPPTFNPVLRQLLSDGCGHGSPDPREPHRTVPRRQEALALLVPKKPSTPNLTWSSRACRTL
jgi:hypothetical protein